MVEGFFILIEVNEVWFLLVTFSIPLLASMQLMRVVKLNNRKEIKEHNITKAKT